MKRTLHDSRLRSARGTLLWGFTGFVVLQLGLAIGMEHWFPEFQHPCYAVKAGRLRQRLSKEDKPLSIVMLGSSRTTFGFRGAVSEEVLGTSGKKEDCTGWVARPEVLRGAWNACKGPTPFGVPQGVPPKEFATEQDGPLRTVVAFNFGILGAGRSRNCSR